MVIALSGQRLVPVRHCQTELTSWQDGLAPHGCTTCDRLLLPYFPVNGDGAVFGHPMELPLASGTRTASSPSAGESTLPGVPLRPPEAAHHPARLLATVDPIELDGAPRWAQANFVGRVKHLPAAETFRCAKLKESPSALLSCGQGQPLSRGSSDGVRRSVAGTSTVDRRPPKGMSSVATSATPVS